MVRRNQAGHAVVAKPKTAMHAMSARKHKFRIIPTPPRNSCQPEYVDLGTRECRSHGPSKDSSNPGVFRFAPRCFSHACGPVHAETELSTQLRRNAARATKAPAAGHRITLTDNEKTGDPHRDYAGCQSTRASPSRSISNAICVPDFNANGRAENPIISTWLQRCYAEPWRKPALR